MSFDIVSVPCQHLLVREQMRLQFLPHKMVAFLLLEVHCMPHSTRMSVCSSYTCVT